MRESRIFRNMDGKGSILGQSELVHDTVQEAVHGVRPLVSTGFVIIRTGGQVIS